MKTYIQVIESRVHWRFDADTNPYEGNLTMDVRDVTNVSPSPQEGWLVNQDGTYSAPPAPPAPPAPVKSWDALTWKRKFTQAERIAIRSAAASSAAITDYLDLLDTGAAVLSRVRADDPDVLAALDAMTTAGLLAVGRKAEVLAS